MLDDSLFAGSDLHKRDVEIDGKTHELWFKELPAVEFIRFHGLSTSADENVRSGASARLVAACLVTPEGNQAISYEKALTLKSKPLNAIFAAVLEVNGGSSGKL